MCFLLGNAPGLHFMCRRFGIICLFHLRGPMKTEQTESSEMSAYKIQTPSIYPEERKQSSEHGNGLKLRTSLIAHALVDFNVLLTVTFITTNNSHNK